MVRPIHFDLSADDPQRAAQFYAKLFGWSVERWQGPEEYWMMQTGTEQEPGITGGVAARIRSEDSTVVIFDVAAVDEVARRVVEVGGSIREQKRAITGVGYLVMCRDTEGNTFGIMEIDQSAG